VSILSAGDGNGYADSESQVGSAGSGCCCRLACRCSWPNRAWPHGIGSHQVSWPQVTGCTSQERSSTASNLPGKKLPLYSIFIGPSLQLIRFTAHKTFGTNSRELTDTVDNGDITSPCPTTSLIHTEKCDSSPGQKSLVLLF